MFLSSLNWAKHDPLSYHAFQDKEHKLSSTINIIDWEATINNALRIKKDASRTI